MQTMRGGEGMQSVEGSCVRAGHPSAPTPIRWWSPAPRSSPCGRAYKKCRAPTHAGAACRSRVHMGTSVHASGSREGVQPGEVLFPLCHWEDVNRLCVVSRVARVGVRLQSERTGNGPLVIQPHSVCGVRGSHTLNPKPQTLNPKPYSLSPKPQPQTPAPKP